MMPLSLSSARRYLRLQPSSPQVTSYERYAASHDFAAATFHDAAFHVYITFS